MKYYGTKNNRDYGFYENKFDGAIEISDEQWVELLDKQNNGYVIILYNGNVISVKENEYEEKDGIWHKLSKDEVQTRQLNIQNEIRKQEIKEKLEDLDKKRIRALSEPALKDEETTWLEYYNTQIFSLRQELNQL